MIKYFQLLVLIFITSCASIPQTLVTFNKEVIKTPSLNTEISQELGNTLVEYSVLSYVDSISINEEYRTEPNFAGLYYVFPSQTLKPVTINQDGIVTYQFENISAFGALSINGPIPNVAFYRGTYTNKGLCVVIATQRCIPNNLIIEKKYFYLSQPNVKQQLIYNGRVGDYVKFLYREVSEGKYLRPFFTQEVQYDLNEGKTIGFRGTRIEIIEASNREITYVVTKHFDPIL